MKINSSELSHLEDVFENELRNNILGYWMRFGVEPDKDGFYGEVDIKGTPIPDGVKSCVLNARILWTFAEAARRFDNQHYAIIADRAYHVLHRYFKDPQYGGYYMSIDSNNRPHDTIKHTYVQAFVLYALSSYYRLNGTGEHLEEITRLFLLLEEKTKDRENPGYFEAFTSDWQLMEENRMADHNEPRSMNTHLHILEAYAAFYRLTHHSLASTRLKELLILFLEKIIRPSGHLGIFFDYQFNETDQSSAICSFGHDIEASWLLCEAAEALEDGGILKQTQSVGIRMLKAVDRDGIDKDGGLFLESTRNGSHVRTNKHWWPQAETLVALMNGYQLTGDPIYWEKLKLSWNFIDRCVIDHENGEWFTKVNRHGVPFLEEPPEDPSPYYRNDRKIDPWKCPYHNGRAMMELLERIAELKTENPEKS